MNTTVPAPPVSVPGNPLEALLRCLEAEYHALLADDAARLESVLAQKQQLLAQLSERSSAALGQPQGDGLRARAPWKAAIARLRALNARNAMVLGPRATANRARLQFLQSALGRTTLYGADGVVRPVVVMSPTGR